MKIRRQGCVFLQGKGAAAAEETQEEERCPRRGVKVLVYSVLVLLEAFSLILDKVATLL